MKVPCFGIFRIGILFLVLLAAPGAEAIGILGSTAPYLSVGAGIFNMVGAVNDDGYNHTPAEINLEYQSGEKIFGIGLGLGLLANTDGAVYGYGGFFSDIALSKHWILTPFAGLGGYHQGQSKNMGSTFLFRLELGLAYQLDSGDRIGLKIAHLSNGDLYRRNPGENEVQLTYSFPLS
ncbi:MAG: acyloxyacyl hydrolase [Acidithiobacillus sp.]|nr:acyloxyacyl hydrolase [Acidithiobacillus sp.]